MDKPADGPLTKHGPYIRNAQPIGRGLFLVEAQRGTQAKGKVWYPLVLAPNPCFGKPRYPGSTAIDDRQLQEVAEVKVAQGKYQIPGTMKAIVYGTHADEKRRFIEGYFPDEVEAVQFIVRNATEMFK